MHSFGSGGFDEVPTLNQGEWILVGCGVSDRVTSDACTLQNYGVNGGARGVMVAVNNIKRISEEFDEGRAPQGELVYLASVSFGAGPGGGDYRCYELELPSGDGVWCLWDSMEDEYTEAATKWQEAIWELEEGEDEPPRPQLYRVCAQGEASSDADPAAVASVLLEASWRADKTKWGTDLELLSVDGEGLLLSKELYAIRDIAGSLTTAGRKKREGA